jgi:hypothetical protein
VAGKPRRYPVVRGRIVPRKEVAGKQSETQLSVIPSPTIDFDVFGTSGYREVAGKLPFTRPEKKGDFFGQIFSVEIFFTQS